MKRTAFLVAVALMASLPLFGQDSNILCHYSLSAGVGTTGFTLDLGTMLTDYIGLRGGADYLPAITYNNDLDLSYIYQETILPEMPEGLSLDDIPERVAVEGKLEGLGGHALMDIYPFKGADFHLTVGAYISNKAKVVTVYNKDEGSLRLISDFNARRGPFADIPADYGQVAAKLGEYNVTPDDNGNANAYFELKKVRPYVGLGFGRVVPRASRLNCQFDLGVQLTGKPRVYDGVNGQELSTDGVKGEAGGVLKSIGKIKVYPMLSLRLVGRLF